jgi:hypothetical protein
MKRAQLRTYLDTVAVSAYIAYPPESPLQYAQWSAVQALFETAERRGIRFVSSRYTLEEAKQGHKGAAQRRINALRKVTLVPETRPIRQNAADLIAQVRQESERGRLAGDARHFACAWGCKAKYLVTWNTRDFDRLAGLALALGWQDLPEVVTPSEAAFALGTGVVTNPPTMLEALNRKTPWIQKIIKENKRVQAKLAGPFLKAQGLL